jgi:hypothetical protein
VAAGRITQLGGPQVYTPVLDSYAGNSWLCCWRYYDVGVNEGDLCCMLHLIALCMLVRCTFILRSTQGVIASCAGVGTCLSQITRCDTNRVTSCYLRNWPFMCVAFCFCVIRFCGLRGGEGVNALFQIFPYAVSTKLHWFGEYVENVLSVTWLTSQISVRLLRVCPGVLCGGETWRLPCEE